MHNLEKKSRSTEKSQPSHNAQYRSATCRSRAPMAEHLDTGQGVQPPLEAPTQAAAVSRDPREAALLLPSHSSHKGPLAAPEWRLGLPRPAGAAVGCLGAARRRPVGRGVRLSARGRFSITVGPMCPSAPTCPCVSVGSVCLSVASAPVCPSTSCLM